MKEHGERYLELGEFALGSGTYEAAVVHLKRAVQYLVADQGPSSLIASAHSSLARAFAALYWYQDATAHLCAAYDYEIQSRVSNDRRIISLLVQLASVFRLMYDYREALTLLGRARIRATGRLAGEWSLHADVLQMSAEVIQSMVVSTRGFAGDVRGRANVDLVDAIALARESRLYAEKLRLTQPSEAAGRTLDLGLLLARCSKHELAEAYLWTALSEGISSLTRGHPWLSLAKYQLGIVMREDVLDGQGGTLTHQAVTEMTFYTRDSSSDTAEQILAVLSIFQDSSSPSSVADPPADIDMDRPMGAVLWPRQSSQDYLKMIKRVLHHGQRPDLAKAVQCPK